MKQIHPHELWVGHLGDSLDHKQMFDVGIKALFALAAEEAVVPVSRELMYFHFPLLDGSENDEPTLESTISTLANVLRKKIPTLVCCGSGMSRSPSIAAAALSLSLDKSADQCLEYVGACHRSDVSPGLWMEIKQVTQKLSSRSNPW